MIDETYNSEWGEITNTLDEAMFNIISVPGITQEAFARHAAIDVEKMFWIMLSVNNGKLLEDVLDYGCGIGRLMKEIAPFCIKITGFDACEKMIDYSKTYLKGINNTTTEVSDKIDIYENRFSFIYSILTFQHINKEDVWVYMDQIHSALRNGGKALIHFYKGRDRSGLARLRMVSWETEEIKDMVECIGFSDYYIVNENMGKSKIEEKIYLFVTKGEMSGEEKNNVN